MTAGRLAGMAILCAFCFLTCITVAQAQTYADEYQAYLKSLERLDQEGAAEHAYAAWRDAEKQLGDHELTAVLAYNYGQLVLFDDPATALKALKRTRALLEDGVAAELPQKALQLYIAYAEFTVSGGKFSKSGPLRRALSELDQSGAQPTRSTARMWFELATADMLNKRYDAAQQSTERARAAIAGARPGDTDTLAKAIIMQGAAYLFDKSRRKPNIIEAVHHFREAIALYPPQDSIDAFDTTFAQALGWEYAAKVVFEQAGYRDRDYPEDQDEGRELIKGRPTEKHEKCNVEWEERPAPDYPSGALTEGYVGAVIIGYHLKENKAVDIRVLSEVPAGKFSEATLESAQKWRLKHPPLDTPECRTDYITFTGFVFTDG